MVQITKKIDLLNDWIIVQSDDATEKTESGIILTDETKILKNTGEVVEIGRKVGRVNVGDRIAHAHFFGMELEYLGKLCYLMQESDVIVRL